MSVTRRRLIQASVLAAATTPWLGACSQPADTDGSISLRMSWWGNETRAQITSEMLDLFEKSHQSTTVIEEPGAWDGYHDKLSVQVAGDDAPDVMQLQEEFMATFGGNGALLELTDVDLSLLDPGTTANGVADGQQVAVPAGISTLAFVANLGLFAEAGVEVPDDTTWSWEDYAEIATTISANLGGKRRGTKSLGWDIAEMASWVSQQGNQLFTPDGKVGATVEDFASLFRLAAQLVADGAAPPPSETVEQFSLSPEQSGVATGRYAMQLDAVSNLPALQNAAAEELKLLRLPSATGEAGDAHMMFVASQYWSASGRSDHPEAAQQLIDFLVNSNEAGKLSGLARGVPANSETRAALSGQLEPTEQATVDFIDTIAHEVVPAPPRPAGSSTFTQNFQRYATEVLFDRMSAEEAAEGLLKETTEALDAA